MHENINPNGSVGSNTSEVEPSSDTRSNLNHRVKNNHHHHHHFHHHVNMHKLNHSTQFPETEVAHTDGCSRRDIRNCKTQITLRPNSIKLGSSKSNISPPTPLANGATINQREAQSSWANFEGFCSSTSLHGWKYLSKNNVNHALKIGWICVVLGSMGVAGFFLSYSCNDFLASKVQTTQDTSRAMLDQVYFPSVTLCNINQGRRSFFLEQGLHTNRKLLRAVLAQVYFGTQSNLSDTDMADLRGLFSSEEVIRKGILADVMYMQTSSKNEARGRPDMDDWEKSKNHDFITDAGWFFKTLAAQEPGEDSVLAAKYGRLEKEVWNSTHLLPFFGTDYGLCSLIKPQITFNWTLDVLSFESLMTNYSNSITPGIQLGKENGLSLLLDAEVYDYAFSPQKGEGFKLAIHSHMDQPIMALSDIDLSPGFVTQLSVIPTLRATTEQARKRFSPEERGCYFDGELVFKYLPATLYRYGLSNCLFAATYDQILEQCQCVPFFHTMAYSDYPRICSGKSLLCMNIILRDIGSHTHVKAIDENGDLVWKPCLFACKDQSFTTSVTTSTFPNMHTFLRGPEFCLMLRKLVSSCTTSKNVTLEEQYPGMCRLIQRFPELCTPNSKFLEQFDAITTNSNSEEPIIAENTEKTKIPLQTTDVIDIVDRIISTEDSRKEAITLIALLHKYARENLLLANIYIKDPAVTLIKRDQKIPVIWFVANVGGILGLTMGCSLVTIFEVLHHFILMFLRTSARGVLRIHKTMRCHSPNKGQKAVMSSQNDLNADNHLDDTKTSQEIPKVAKPRRRKFSFVSSRYVNNNGVQKNRKGFSIIKKAALSRTTDNPGSDTSIRSIQDLEEKC